MEWVHLRATGLLLVLLFCNILRLTLVFNKLRTFCMIMDLYNFQIWFNNKGYVAMVAYMNVFSNMILRANLPAGEDPSKYGISVVNHPMNRTEEQLEEYLM